jgi:hypothetical protein
LALIGRILVVLFAYLVASFASAAVLVVGFLLPLAGGGDAVVVFNQIFGVAAAAIGDPRQALLLTVGLAASLIASAGLVPAMVLIAIAEGFRLRSVLLYGALGGATGIACLFGFGVDPFAAGLEASPLPPRATEIVAAAGIAAGFVYWALAGRSAGAWQRPDPTAASIGAGKQ